MPIGSSSRVVKLPDMVIPNGQVFSNILNSWNMYGDSAGITLYALATNAAGTYVVQVSPEPSADASSPWMNWGTPSGDLIAPAPGDAITYTELVTVGSIRIAASAAVTGAQTFRATKHAII